MWTSATAKARRGPGDRADPGLASVRGLDWLGPKEDAKGSSMSTTRGETAPARGDFLVEKDGFEPEIRFAVLPSAQSETPVQPKSHLET
jgi:hypothetical protein